MTELLFSFEKLEVYDRSIQFDNTVLDVYEALEPRHQIAIGNNLVRASLSISNNIAEGYGRRHKKEKAQFYSIAQGSAFECVPSLRVLNMRKLITDKQFDNLYHECAEIAKMLTGLIASVGKRSS